MLLRPKAFGILLFIYFWKKRAVEDITLALQDTVVDDFFFYYYTLQ